MTDKLVLCKPVVPHQLKMMAKKTLRKLHGHSAGWRNLVDETYKEIFEDGR